MNESTLPSARVRAARRALLRWYDRSKRDLPWRRRADDPYAQWVAEIMLQQTRTQAVRDYYDRFLHRFPDVESLADAPLSEVLRHWQGLGYYRRAEHLHAAARQVARAGRWPSDQDAWRELPGVGAYTAAALASICLGEPAAAVDGNVIRVLSRLVPIQDVSGAEGQRAVRRAADRLLSRTRPGDMNQAWMDLGATVCLPARPSCEACPLRSVCASGVAGRGAQLPVRRPRDAPIAVRRVVLGVFANDCLLLQKRSSGGRWANLWELPNLPDEEGSSPPDLDSLARSLAIENGQSPVFCGEVQHRLTHRLYSFRVYRTRVEERGLHRRPVRGRRWVKPAGIARLPVSSAHTKIIALLNK